MQVLEGPVPLCVVGTEFRVGRALPKAQCVRSRANGHPALWTLNAPGSAVVSLSWALSRESPAPRLGHTPPLASKASDHASDAACCRCYLARCLPA